MFKTQITEAKHPLFVIYFIHSVDKTNQYADI